MANATRHDAMLNVLSRRLVDAAGLSPGEGVLDVGCGYGTTALQVARAVMPGPVLGMDLSGLMLDAARRQAASSGLGALSFVQGDAQIYAFAASSFDVVVSRFGVMFFTDPTAAFSNIAHATRSRGRLAFLCWREIECNERAALPLRVVATHAPCLPPPARGGPGPYSLADPSRIRELLVTAGYEQIHMEAVDESLRIGDDADDVLRYYRAQPSTKSCIAGVGPARVEGVLAALRAELVAHETPAGVFLPSAAWLVTAQRQ